MAIKPSPEDSARHILSVYISRGLSAGHGMLHQNFVKAFSPPELWTKDDLAHGMEFAMTKRWIELGQNSHFVLTAAGFAAAQE